MGGVGILEVNLSVNLMVEKDVGDYLSQGSANCAKSGLTPIFGNSNFVEIQRPFTYKYFCAIK